MKLNVTLLNNSETLLFEIDENELIDSISFLLNRELKTSNVDYYFLFNKTILETGKTLAQLNLPDNCKIYAVKENKLKRKEPTESVIEFGAFDSKRKCVIRDEKSFEHIIWNNKSLVEMQKQLSDCVKTDPSLFESLILDPGTKEMIENPSLVTDLFSTNTSINQLIKTEQDQVKFITDASQYAWIQDIMASSDQLDRIITNHGEHVQHALNSTRYRRMLDTLEKTSKVTEEPVTVSTELRDELEDFADDTLETITKSSISNHIIDLMHDNHAGLATSLLRSCPYGPSLSEASLSAIESILPTAMNQLKEAIARSNEPSNVVEYLRSNPIEIEPDVAVTIEQVSSQFGDMVERVGTDESARSCMPTLLSELRRRMGADTARVTNEQESTPEESRFEKEMALLSVMGFVDSAANAAALQASYGNIDRAVAQLLSV